MGNVLEIATLKAAIHAYIINRGGDVTFVELMKEFDDEKGDKNMSANFDTLIMWMGLSENLAKALIELENEEKLRFKSTGHLTYMLDGGGINLPLAKIKRDYKKPHWLPVVMNAH